MTSSSSGARRPRYGSARERREFDADFAQPHPPHPPQHPQMERVRSFRRTRRGLVNDGDLLVRGGGARSSCSLNSSAGSSCDFELTPTTATAAAAAAACGQVAACGQNPQQQQPHQQPHQLCQFCRVQVVGAPRVGRTSLCEQFLSSECRALDTCGDYEDPTDCNPPPPSPSKRFVTVLLDGEEYHVTFLDIEASDEATMYFVNADACMVVFSLDCRRSFVEAKQILAELTEAGECRRAVALMLVANKSDLVRGREVPHDEAKSLAAAHGACYAEVSAALNHGVDELLVAALTEIRSRQRKAQKEKMKLMAGAGGCDGGGGGGGGSGGGGGGGGSGGFRPRLRTPRRMVGEFIRKHFSSKSCDSLSKNA